MFAVGNRDDVCGLVDSALKFALVAQRVGIRVDRVNVCVTGLAECGVATVGSIDGVKEGVEEAAAAFETKGIEEIVCLKEDGVLRIDNGVRARK